MTSAPANDDDFFGDQDVGESAAREREWNALRRKHVKAGFREGSERGHDDKMQDGFDDGFLAGAKLTADAGYWLGMSAVIEAFHKHAKSTSSRVPEEHMNALKEAREALELAANNATEETTRLDVAPTRDACEKILSIGCDNTPRTDAAVGDTTQPAREEPTEARSA